ncbi:MAG: hypothetical protein V4643_09425 [Bacteroidota bacterium]
MTVIEEIREVFSTFHDGTILAWTGNKNLLTLTIDCQYLARKIDKSFDTFYVVLSNIDKIELVPWTTPIDIPAVTITEIPDIFKGDLEILSADMEDDESVVIICAQHDTNFNYSGGHLTISCQTIKVYDQNKNEITIDQLEKICFDYWNKK